MQVLARSEKIFRIDAENRRRRSADDHTGTRATLDRLSAGNATKPRAAEGGSPTIGKDGRPTISPVVCHENTNTDNAQPRRKLSAYVRGIKELSSSPPPFHGSSTDKNTTARQGGASDENVTDKNATARQGADTDEKVCVDAIDAAELEGAPMAQRSERRDSAVNLAAKRVAIRKRREKAEQEARIRVGV